MRAPFADIRLTISDAPLRCGDCGEIIIGSGTGALWILLDAIAAHWERCKGEPEAGP